MKKNKSILSLFQRYPAVPIAVFFFIVAFVFIPEFRTGTNLASFGAQLSYIGICATGFSFILIGAGNDMSSGMAISASSVIAGLAMTSAASAASTVLGIVVILLASVALAALNGYFIAYIKINPFMMTLITQYIYKGLALLLTNSKSITGLPEGFLTIGSAKIAGVPVSIIVMLIVFVIGQIVLSKTKFGRELFAAGANEKAARLVGIKTNWVLFKTYIIGGVCNAISAIILIGKLGCVNPTMGNELYMDFLSAAVIGGNSMFGGKGSIVGAAFGVVIIGLISNCLNLLGVDYQDQKWIKGIIILLAIAMDTLQGKIAAKRMLKISSSEEGRITSTEG